MAYRRDRYGIPAADVCNLGSRYYKYNFAKGFGTLDNFLKFCAEAGYERHMHICKRDPSKPHSPENSYFRGINEKEATEIAEPNNWICKDCKTQKCKQIGRGCERYTKAWIENWNKNIHRKKPEDPRKRMVFRYEHPDLVRERIVWGKS